MLNGRGSVLCVGVAAFTLGTLVAEGAFTPYGTCAHVTRGENVVKTAEIVCPLGLGWIRSDLDWRTVEKEKGVWDFSRFDKVVADLEAYDLQLLPILGYSVPWADPAHEHLDAWEEYVRRCVTHYGKRLPVVEVWNEQNISIFWKNPNPTNYLALLRRTYETVKRIEPSVKVGFGGVAGIPLGFIEEVYRLGGAKFFDIMMVHPYTPPRPPEGKLEEELERLRELMARYGDGNKPIWASEGGYPTNKGFTDGEILRMGLKAVDPQKSAWRVIYIPAHDPVSEERQIAELRTMLPDGMTFEICRVGMVKDRLRHGDVDVVFYPLGEDYALDSVPAVYEFVKKGGVLVDLGGMPMWSGTRADAAGEMKVVKGAPTGNDRRRFRIDATAWWMDKRYPQKMAVYPTKATAGATLPWGGFESARFFTDRLLKRGDRFIPLLSAPTNGISAVAAAVYKFNSDMKGSVIVSGLFPRTWGNHVDGLIDESRQAKLLARYLGIIFAEGVSAASPYNLRSHEGTPFDPEAHFGLVRARYAPKPSYGAYMTYVERRPVGSVQKTGVAWRSDDRTFYFPQWKRPDGSAAGMIWTTGKPKTLHLVFSSDRIQFVDVNGSSLHAKRNGDGYDVRVGDAPVYFCGGELKVDSVR